MKKNEVSQGDWTFDQMPFKYSFEIYLKTVKTLCHDYKLFKKLIATHVASLKNLVSSFMKKCSFCMFK